MYARPGHRLWTRGSALCVRRQALLKAVFSAHVATGLTEAAEDGARGRTQRRARAYDWLGPSIRQIPRCMKCWLAKAASSSSRHRRVRVRPAFGGRAPWAESSDHHRRVTPGAGVVRMVKFATPHGRVRPALGLRGSLRRRRSVSVDTRVVSSSPHGVLGTRTWKPHPAAPLWSSKAHGCHASWGSSCLRSCLPSAPASAAYRGVASPPAAVRACYPLWASRCWVSS